MPVRTMNLEPDFAQRRLLVVDDDHDLVDALCEWVRLNSGWATAGAYSPDDAIAQAGAVPPDAILLDMEMGAADGFDTAERLDRASGSRHPPLFALTGNPSLRDAAALDVRFAASMLKPADLEALLRLLDGTTRAH